MSYLINSFTIIDHGDERVGIFDATYELEGPFLFDSKEHKRDFVEAIKRAFDEHLGTFSGNVGVQDSLSTALIDLPFAEAAAEEAKRSFDEIHVHPWHPEFLSRYERMLEAQQAYIEIQEYVNELKSLIRKQGEIPEEVPSE